MIQEKRKQKCDMCGKIGVLYTVRITKEDKEKWCKECIEEEENWNKK